MKLVMVTWVDSVQPAPRWVVVDDEHDHAAVKCVSVGWLKEHPDSIVLYPNMSEDLETGCGVFIIPKCAVVRIDQLKKGSKL